MLGNLETYLGIAASLVSIISAYIAVKRSNEVVKLSKSITNIVSNNTVKTSGNSRGIVVD